MAKNVLGTPLLPCSMKPKTGYFRDGTCNTCTEDYGSHTVCVVLTESFLRFSFDRGNDLTTPMPNFPGLKPGDKWCLCASRWKEAFQAGVAPNVVLESTHENALSLIALEDLSKHAIRI